MSRRRKKDRVRAPLPSWQNAKTDLDQARRQLAQALPAVERAAAELAALRESSAAVARMEIARQLVAGPSGGALSLLAAAAAERADALPGSGSQAAALALAELCAALGLTRVHDVGAVVALDAAQLADVEIIGAANGPGDHVVMRPGWRIGEKWLARPVVATVARPEPAPQSESPVAR
jgi:hypothetical protein